MSERRGGAGAGGGGAGAGGGGGGGGWEQGPPPRKQRRVDWVSRVQDILRMQKPFLLISLCHLYNNEALLSRK